MPRQLATVGAGQVAIVEELRIIIVADVAMVLAMKRIECGEVDDGPPSGESPDDPVERRRAKQCAVDSLVDEYGRFGDCDAEWHDYGDSQPRIDAIEERDQHDPDQRHAKKTHACPQPPTSDFS